ncbi:alpha/beta hydrolase [Albibacillus kandeliae]|uniref:alpha/beta hydrolase n=1 Tax=Albibacillus kandeliae TaxID=2174228 RepID=UPI000D68CAF3|nr:alpha/beta hydrolase [Albibacillus kandeliae]
MTLQPAPFFDDLAGGPQGGAAWWLTASDGVKLRVGYWPCDNARGTLLLFPGRTEYIEKYGRTAAELAERGYAMVAIDWRGQGLADRLIDDVRVGHVVRFTDYQRDVAAVMEWAAEMDLPRPWHVLGHSMGGAIGLRAVMEGLPVQSCAFTGPMWGIYMSALLKPFGWVLPRVANLVGMGNRLPPSTRYESYVLSNPFEGNMLTTDAEMFRMMQHQLESHPELALGGPSMIWLREALEECKSLARQPSPDLPCITFIGADESIIDTAAAHDRMRRWPRGELDVVPGAQHEVLMETPETRARVFDRLDALFSGQIGNGSSKHCA